MIIIFMRFTRKGKSQSLKLFCYTDLGQPLSTILGSYSTYLTVFRFTLLTCQVLVSLQGRDGMMNLPIKKQSTTSLTRYKNGGRRSELRSSSYSAIVSEAILARSISKDIQRESASSFLFLQPEHQS